LVELVKVFFGHLKEPQLQSWCGLIENNSWSKLEHLPVFMQEPDFHKLFLGLFQTSSITGLE
jgi:hypothetical protein